MKRIFVAILLVLFINQAYSQDLFSLQNGKKFADYLYKKSYFEQAAFEYERLLFLEPDNDTLKLNLVEAYRRLGKPDIAISRSRQLYASIEDYPFDFAISHAILLLQNNSFSDFNSFVNSQNLFDEQEKKILVLYETTLSGNWKIAYTQMRFLKEGEIYQNKNLESIITNGVSIKYKSPAKAAIFSAILPGSGKFYTKNRKDALIGLVMIGGSAFSSYRGFNKNGISSFQGWFFGGIATGFYGGNIYGSYKAAILYNDKIDIKLNNEAKEVIFNSFY
jgi:tetratricopeptide (TPR) repeat protein